MSVEPIRSLVYNASLLLVLSVVSVYVTTGKSYGGTKQKILVGLLNGIICVISMVNPAQLSAGLTVESSAVLLGITAMFYGMEPVLITLLFFITGKVVIGGAGALPDVVSANICVAAGLLWNKYRLGNTAPGERKQWLEFGMMGVIFGAASQIGVIATSAPAYFSQLLSLNLPSLFIDALGTLFICMIIRRQIKTAKQKADLVETIAENVLRNRELTAQAETKEVMLRSLFGSVSDLVYYKDKNCVYIDCNTAYETFLRKDRKEIIGSTDFHLFPLSVATSHVCADMEVLSLGCSKINEETAVNQNGDEVVLETFSAPCRNEAGEIIGLIGISRDITEQKRKEAEIQYLTYHDLSTGLYNANYMDLMRSRYAESAPLPLSVILCDLNGLKLINDAFGHTEGNKLLREAAALLKKCARPSDIIARVGGDEFCLLLPNTDSFSAQALAASITAACQEFKGSSDCPYAVNLALGYATVETPGEPIDQAFKNAEDFMNKKKLLDFQSMHNSVISSIKTTMYEKSLETEEHAERLAGLTVNLGKHLGLHDEELIELKLFAMLHDIGKIGIDERILTKTDKLTEEDWLEIRKHPEIGYRITHASSDLKDISDYILHHHERWDGRGYPLGLSGQQIPLLSRVLSIVDSYDAMTNDRVYRKALSESEAVAEIVRNAGTQFDPSITEIFVQVIMSAGLYRHAVSD